MSAVAPESELKPHPIQIWIVHFIRWYLLHPLTVAGGMAIGGILIAENWHLKVDAFLIGLIMASLALMLWFRTRWSRAPLVLTVFMALHAYQIERTFYHPLFLDLQSISGSSKPAYIRARLYPWPDGVSLNEKRALAEVLSLSWSKSGAQEPVTTKFRVNLPANFKLIQAGVYELAGNLSLPAVPMNPGQFDQRTYALRAGWIADLKAVTVKMIEADAWAPRFHLLRWAETSRQWITEALSLGIEEQKRELGVLLAMALGVSEAAGEEVEEAFRGSGTLHIFAISGLHVVMLAGVMGFMLRWSGVGKARSVVWLIGLVFCYAYITGWRPSAARSADDQHSFGGAVVGSEADDSEQSRCSVTDPARHGYAAAFWPGFSTLLRSAVGHLTFCHAFAEVVEALDRY
jgi:predicted membrane metal-binding protein